MLYHIYHHELPSCNYPYLPNNNSLSNHRRQDLRLLKQVKRERVERKLSDVNKDTKRKVVEIKDVSEDEGEGNRTYEE